MTLIRCPWPPTELRPNFITSNHWSKWRFKVKPYKRFIDGLAKEQSVHMRKWPAGDIHLTYTFYPPKGCRWDDDAKEGAFKHGQDALADVMKVNDKHFRVEKLHIAERKGLGCVLVQILTEPVENVNKTRGNA